MQDRSSKKRPRDLNALAAAIVQEATDPAEPEAPTKDPLAVALGRRGGKKGGKARAATCHRSTALCSASTAGVQRSDLLALAHAAYATR